MRTRYLFMGFRGDSRRVRTHTHTKSYFRTRVSQWYNYIIFYRLLLHRRRTTSGRCERNPLLSSVHRTRRGRFGRGEKSLTTDFFQTLVCVCVCVCFIYYFFNEYVRVHSYFLIFSVPPAFFFVSYVTPFFVADMNEILSSQVHERFGEEDDENNNLNGPRRLLAENLDYQQMELTTEDREDHTFNGTKLLLLLFSF